MEASIELGFGGLGSEKENLKTQLRSCRPGKRVLVEGLRSDEPAAQICKKVRVGQERDSSSRREVGRSRPVSRSWSECNLGPGQAFGSLGGEGAAQRSLFGREPEGGALQELVAKPLNVQPERLGSRSGKLPLLVSPLGGPLAFTIKVQRHGRTSEPPNDLESNAVSAGSFASTGRSSLLGKSNRGDSVSASREADNLPSCTVSKEPSPLIVREDPQPLFESRAPLRKSFSQPKSVEKTISADVESATMPNAALSETPRRRTQLSVEQEIEVTAPQPVRRSSRNRAPSSVRDEDPIYAPAQSLDDDMPESKRSSRAKTTRKPKPAFDDAEVTPPTHVERQSESHEEEHLPPVTGGDGGKPPRKRAAVKHKAPPEAHEESSWSHPKALKKRTPANRSATGNAQVSPIPYCRGQFLRYIHTSDGNLAGRILANYCVVMK
jgi:hypothetical protein